MIVPLAINYLDNDQYGIWLTVSSFISWFSFFDIGLGNGLRNKLTEAIALGRDDLAKAYISTTYYTIGGISVMILLLFLIANQFIDWTYVFNTRTDLKNELNILLPVIFSFFCIQLVVKLITTIYLADQHHSIQGKIQFFAQSISLFAVWILTMTEGNSLLIFGSIFAALPPILLLGFNFYSFNRRYKNYKPNIRLWKRSYLKSITSLGFSFFIIQIAALIIFSTDNVIISYLFGPDEVVPYNVAYKYFTVVIMVFSIIISPYWSSFTDAYTKGDLNWIRDSVNKIQIFWLVIPFGLIFMLYISNWFYDFWLGEKVIVPLNLSAAMAIYVLLMTFNMVYVYFINGVGKIKLQLIVSIVVIIINIPLSVYFGKILNMGSLGIIIATCICVLIGVILWPIQYSKILNIRAHGIWNK